MTLSTAAVADDASFSSTEISPVWAGHPVGFYLLTERGHQFIAFYDADRQMTIAMRPLSETTWRFKKLPSQIGWDSHNSLTLGLDREGHIHVSGNMHNDPLVYFRSSKPFDIESLQKVDSMTGQPEARVTYPRFFKNKDGQLFFSYRNGGSGDGDTFLNYYDESTKAWTTVGGGALFDGLARMNAYPSWPPTKGPDGYFHLIWVWRDNPDASTNHDLSYLKTRDFITWESAAGDIVTPPFHIDQKNLIADPIPVKGGLLNGAPKIGFDLNHRPIISYYKYDENGATQAYLARFENDEWKVRPITQWTHRFDISGRGSLPSGQISVGAVRPEQDKLVISLGNQKEAGGTFEVNPSDLSLGARLPSATSTNRLPRSLRKVESTFPEMQVKWAPDSGTPDEGKTYILKWETLPANYDKPREMPWPEPSKLRLIELGSTKGKDS